MTGGLVFAIPLIFAGPSFAADATGNGALSLAALVGQHSPALTAAEEHLLVAYLDGRPKSALSTGQEDRR